MKITTKGIIIAAVAAVAVLATVYLLTVNHVIG
jgi:hypothetical protein